MLLPENPSRIVAELLRNHVGKRLPLAKAGFAGSDAPTVISLDSTELFPEARNAEAARAGLLLRLGGWDAAHAAADTESQDAYYWHAIIHRMEPDSWNSAYWFRKVGVHPIFSDLQHRTAAILNESAIADWKLRSTWDPASFIRWCEEARATPGSSKAETAIAIQEAEWELLFAWCASPPPAPKQA